jgi:hypothetical protein
MDAFRCVVAAAALALAGPVWAHGGHDRDRGHHHHGHGHDRAPEWGHHKHHHGHWDRAPGPVYYNQYYYAPPPVYGYAPPGVQVVRPGVYISLY